MIARDAATVTEQDLVESVDAARAGLIPPDALVALLEETSPLYAGRGGTEAARRRGWVLAAFEETGLPAAALPYVLEELDTARDPYLCAAAARALRGAPDTDGSFAAHLLRAFSNLQSRDDAVSFDAFRPDWSTASTTTPQLELLATFRWLGAVPGPVVDELRALRATNRYSPRVLAAMDETLAAVRPQPTVSSCCHHQPVATDVNVGAGGLAGVVVEDQDAETVDLVEFLTGLPTVIAFFYTRCENPYKCSATVTRMAQLQQRLSVAGLGESVRLAVITYDDAHDTPAQLGRYGRARGFVPTASHRLLRPTAGRDRLHAFFGLRVGYAGSVVNGHGLELYLTDPDARIAHTWARVTWAVDDVFERALEELPRRTSASAGAH